MKSLALFFAALCLGCAVTYKVIGQRIDEQGVLQEPFVLIPLGYLSGAAAVVTGIAALTCKRNSPLL